MPLNSTIVVLILTLVYTSRGSLRSARTTAPGAGNARATVLVGRLGPAMLYLTPQYMENCPSILGVGTGTHRETNGRTFQMEAN